MNSDQIRHMVNRFLMWRLPKPWNPDNGISYQRPNYAHPPADHDWPTGTSLFDASQAEAMVRHMLEGESPAEGAATPDWKERALEAERERDEARRLIDRMNSETPEGYVSREVLNEAFALLNEAKRSLKPFANEEETWAMSVPDKYRPGITEPNQKTFHARAAFSIGDLRRARALLAKLEAANG